MNTKGFGTYYEIFDVNPEKLDELCRKQINIVQKMKGKKRMQVKRQDLNCDVAIVLFGPERNFHLSY